MATITVRPPLVAGMFYPSEPKTLEAEVSHLLNEVEARPIEGKIVAMIAPHAGYQYSGLTAAYGYKMLNNESFKTVVIVSPSHREHFDGISVYEGTAYRTPLGELQINKQLREQLITDDPIISASNLGHKKEHAVEVQLPFIQKVLGNVSILPIVVGNQKRAYCFHLGERLAEILKGQHALLIASSDLSHYYPYDIANALDQILVDDIAKFDYESMMTHLEQERGEACGGGPMVAVLLAAKKLGANRISVLHHCNSGDVTGDRSGVVGYLSAVALRIN